MQVRYQAAPRPGSSIIANNNHKKKSLSSSFYDLCQ
jgi:hypothetical protein